ncbi:MAG TPA: hypothetical protein VF702_09480 [Allosphingosinicella sp.]|jgi:hypothetical protein
MATRARTWRWGGGATLLLLPFAGAANAQPPSDPLRVRVLTPECENAHGDEIVVCGRRDESRSRYRLPEEPDRGFDPSGAMESVSRERNALTEHGARTGPGSCTNVGPGGWTGCMAGDFRRDIEQYGGDPPSARNGYRRGRR